MGQENAILLMNTLVPLGVIVAFVVVGYGVRRAIDKYVESRSAQDSLRLHHIALQVIDELIVLWFTLIGVSVALQVSTVPVDLRNYADKIVAAVLTLSVTLVAARVLTLVVRHYLIRVEALNPIIPVAQRIGQIAVWTIGLMVALGYLGANITPLLTTLGVAGLATALALQDTLANFFAGFYLLADRPIRVGDYIKLNTTGEEGYVIEIGWRSAKIRTLPNNIVIIPNQKLSQSIITNYHLPEQRMSLLIPVGVSYDCDPEKVEEVLVDIAIEASHEIDGMLSDPPPFVRFIPGFSEYSLDFTLICQVREFVDQYYVQHEMRKRIFARFRQEGIEIPIRTLHLSNGFEERQKANIQSSLRDAVAGDGTHR